MIIPIKCFTCGKVLANKYKYYQTKCKEYKIINNKDESIQYLTRNNMNKTIEGKILDDLQLKKMCCRRHMLTHVDII